MKRFLYGISVRGASHIRKGTECQDSCRVESLSESAVVIAAADGHGSERCPYSGVGAKIAAEVFCSSMKEILESFDGDSLMLRSYLSREGNLKIPESIEREWKRRVLRDHVQERREPPVGDPEADGLNDVVSSNGAGGPNDADGLNGVGGPNVAGGRSGAGDPKEVYKLYGTTLLGLLITTEFVFAFQIGDGDIVLVSRDGVQYAVESEKILGVETHSLSSTDAWKRSAVSVFPSPGPDALPYMFMMSTDGMANSHRTQKEYEKTCMAYYEAAVRYGFCTVASSLEGWLSETSELGCGDDITMVMAYFDKDGGKTGSPEVYRRRMRRRRRLQRHGPARKYVQIKGGQGEVEMDHNNQNGNQNGEKTTRVYLVRHGTTEWNQQLRYQGQTDNPLDEAGEKQGACLENYFRDIHVDLGVTSPLQRAVKTLEYSLASQDHEVPVLVEPGVMEINFGAIDGWTQEEIKAGYPEFYRMYVLNEDRGHAQAPGGESMIQVYNRVTEAVMRIAREHRGENIVIASHGTAIQTFLNFASGIPAEKMDRFLLYNVSVSCAEIDENDNVRLLYYGDKHHVPEELQFSYGAPPTK